MLNRHGPNAGRATRRVWESFVSGESPDIEHLAPAIRASWIRSRQYGINPQLSCAPVEATASNDEVLRLAAPWLGAAEPAFALLRSALSEPHQLVLLTDLAGHVVLSHAGEKARGRAEELNVIVGSNWSEATVGCTAIGACLHDGIPVLANWCESYSCNWHDWVNQAVPLHDPVTREVIGGINIAGFREIIHPSVLELALRTADLIERAIEQRDWRSQADVLQRFQRLRSSTANDACFAVDRHGRLIAFNDAAARRFSMSSRSIGTDIAGLAPIAEMLDPTNAHADASPQRARPIPGVEVIEVGTEHYSGGIYIAPSDKRPRRQHAWPTRYSFADLIGDSAPLAACLEYAKLAAVEDWPVLLEGESGTGKELLAHAIHAAGPRRQGPFVGFSCAGVSDELVAAELFGYCAGSFTGATKDGRIGKVEVANHGTLFLDDVDCMPARMQASLLRVIEDHVVLPVGAVAPRPVDVRIIAATNTDLERACAEGRFRADLYHRLNVIAVQIPPLRARPGDVAHLVPHILARLGVRRSVSERALRALGDYPWPGNVRQLRNMLIRAAMTARGPVIDWDDLPDHIKRPDNSWRRTPAATESRSAGELREREALETALECSTSVADVAEKLGIHFTSVYRRMRKYGILKRFRRRES